MKVNGETIVLNKPVTLSEFLTENKYAEARVAVEINGKIIPKQDYNALILTNNDTLEIVSFVGGG